ncbi:polyketide cyclase [Clostridium botulinum]|uniref:Polyketide cyclase n=1 Tax=Clostridium botulinum TaxID=1491 RepID=A0A6M0SYY8_CLOBO|nr:polyketide cyclase [Clostridium botulinum]NFI74427.1 polyketide cyclase [Clostridium sporogenes]NFP62335.1 polyketide cyclase [Clostridium sporogenes]NFU95513.1 polyketide cyclase [Clostridium sporogenes]NFV70945.1 polyketide cyclase [Clostridium botulinum]
MYLVLLTIIFSLYIIYALLQYLKDLKYNKQKQLENIYQKRNSMIPVLISIAKSTIYDNKVIQSELNHLKSNLNDLRINDNDLMVINYNISTSLDKFIICSSNTPELKENIEYMELVLKIEKLETDIKRFQ